MDSPFLRLEAFVDLWFAAQCVKWLSQTVRPGLNNSLKSIWHATPMSASDDTTAVTMLQAIQSAMAERPAFAKVSFVGEDLQKERR